MPSSNPRYANWKARQNMRARIRQRIDAGERCGICGQPIDTSLPQTYVDPKDGKRKRSPWSWEVDEIVPVSRGGSPIDESNLQPAHRVCNQRKGNGTASRKAPRGVKGATTREW